MGSLKNVSHFENGRLVARRRDGYKTFFEHPHTVAHFRKSLWIPPSYIGRSLIDASQIRMDPSDGLSVEIAPILESHYPTELDETVVREINDIKNSIEPVGR